MTSAYPPKLDQLTDRVRTMATDLGAWPSLRQIKQQCNVGHPKAVEALAALRASGFNPAGTDSEPAPVPAAPRRLKVVSTTDTPDTDDDQADTDLSPAMSTSDPTPAVSEAGNEVTPVAEPLTLTEATPVTADVTSPAPVTVETQKSSRWRNAPLYLIALGAFVAIWGGWVGLGELTGFGPVAPLPGIADNWTINTAITLPLGMEAYAAFAMRVWLDRGKTALARRFAMWSTFAALLLGMSGQVAYHLMKAAGMTAAPWQITTFVSCLPVLVLGGAAALVHLSHNTSEVQR
ncbi:ABC transporter permease [Lentzea sp. BCCO 10_0798]|uniref:ABC transporter permease n=1 Tax=Lentzea kristufekii TaxID=3095430 RepID=A0ABU4TKA6_9PSEU|nr:ABC transporter permease [Lentzea sp. BCCO 10_0798]MDX8048509.1 ABC transporter permease [Lentzea sp. BCCO 10_0798]